MANTLKFGDGKWGAKKDSILAYNDENGNFKPLPFTTSRASTATRINKAGLIEKVENGIPRVDYLGNTKGAMLLEGQSTNKIQYSESFGQIYWTKSGATIQGDPSTAGSEQVVNGDFASDTSWTKGTGWTISGGKANCDGTQVADTVLYQNCGIELGKTYLIEYSVSNLSAGNVRLYIGGTSISSIYRGANGTYTQQIYAEGVGFISIQGDVNFIGSIDNISIKEVQGFASPSAETPLGAFKLVEDTSTGEHVIYKASVTVTSGATVSYSFFAKKGERNVIQTFNFVGGGYSNGADFDLSTGIVSNQISGSGKMLALSNGWYRCEFTSIALVGQSATNVAFRTLNASNQNNYTGNGTSGIYIFGAQLEQQSYATSYIPNYGESAGVTRLVDTCFNGGNDQVINSTEGTIYVEANLIDGYDNNNFLVTIFDNSNGSNNHLFIQRYLGNIQAKIRVGTTQSEITQLNTSFGNKKIAFTYKLNEFKMFVNGSQVGLTDTSGSVFSPNTLDKINVGSFYDKTLNFNSQIKDLKLYNTALTDSELQALTTI